jgi:hypothetical protein
MSASDRPTWDDDTEPRDTVPMKQPWWDIARPASDDERRSIQPGDGIFYWPEEETL